mmetsp:Transcript_22530/g.49326  ORF Transcript_22530/g.49326 Transcript_22530/m.49326 type:complete len:270 (-) Transcript_22530:236-1045(-)
MPPRHPGDAATPCKPATRASCGPCQMGNVARNHRPGGLPSKILVRKKRLPALLAQLPSRLARLRSRRARQTSIGETIWCTPEEAEGAQTNTLRRLWDNCRADGIGIPRFSDPASPSTPRYCARRSRPSGPRCMDHPLHPSCTSWFWMALQFSKSLHHGRKCTANHGRSSPSGGVCNTPFSAADASADFRCAASTHPVGHQLHQYHLGSSSPAQTLQRFRIPTTAQVDASWEPATVGLATVSSCGAPHPHGQTDTKTAAGKPDAGCMASS